VHPNDGMDGGQGQAIDLAQGPLLAGPPLISTEFRQVRRARARKIADHGLKRLLRGISRKARRVGSRAYCNAAWREGRGLAKPAQHRYRRLVLNQEVLMWVVKEAGL
jgi:hypothetical protein